MQNQIHPKPTILSRVIVGILINLDGLSVLILGLLWFVYLGVSDPVGGGSAKSKDLLICGFVILILFVYFIFCNISLTLWAEGIRNWDFYLASLTVLHVGGFGYLLTCRIDFLTNLFFISLGMNLVIATIVFLEKRKANFSK
jgi:hypothetical protein